MNKDLEQAKALLENNEEYTCAACRAGESFASEEHGVRPLMRWLNEGTDCTQPSFTRRILRQTASSARRRPFYMYCWAFGRSTRRL